MRVSASEGKSCTRIGLLVNVLLTGLKLTAGIVGRSQAMIADALHSFSDVVATGGVYLGLKIAEKPADRDRLGPPFRGVLLPGGSDRHCWGEIGVCPSRSPGRIGHRWIDYEDGPSSDEGERPYFDGWYA